MNLQKDTTRLIHTGRHPQAQHGAVNPPIYRTSTVLFPTLADLLAQTQPMTYGRRGTPTTEALAEALCVLEAAEGTTFAPSGLSAITGALLSCTQQGHHLLISDGVYEPTRRFCENTLTRYGLEVSTYPTGADITPYLRPHTRTVFAESPSSLTFEMQDIPALVKTAHNAEALVVMDNTWATPLFFKPLTHGVDVSIQAVTKYISGHADVLLGAVSARGEAWRRMRRGFLTLGLCGGADEAYLALRGLRTLEVRLRQHMENGIALAEWLTQRQEVLKVFHPALKNHPQHTLWKRDFSGASGLFSFLIPPYPQNALAAMLDGMRLFGMGYSWGGFESLLIPVFPSKPWTQKGHLLRLHAGLEHIDDLKKDLEDGFRRLQAHLREHP